MKKITEATPDQIEGARKILKRRNTGLLLMLLYVPSVASIHKITDSDPLSITVAILFLVTIAGFLLSVAFVKCPRCNKMFFTKSYWSNGFASKCMNCGLKGKN